MHPHITALGHYLAHPLRPLWTGGFVFAFICAFAIPYQLSHPHNLRVTPNHVIVGEEGTVAGELIAQNKCWQGEAPKGVTPTRSVVELDPDRGPVLRSAAVGFAIWAKGAPGTLYAFCR